MNNAGHALTTNDIEAVRKAQQEWRLQKRRELEAKARKKQFRLSTSAATQAHQKFPQPPPDPSLSIPTAVTQARANAQAVYARHVTSGPPPGPGPHHNPALYVPTPSAPNTVAGAPQESVAQQVLRQKAIHQQTSLNQMRQDRHGVSPQQARMHQLFQTTREHAQPAVITSAALITTSPGVSIQPQAPNQHPSARPVAPRPSLPNDVSMKNAVAAAAAAANAASAAAVAMRTQLDERAVTGKATEEEAAAAAAAAHAAANVSTADPQYAAMLPANAASVSVSKSTQEAVDVAAAAAAAAASAAIPGASPHGASPLDAATRVKLEQFEAQRRWREEKRRELALKRAKGASSKRGRKRTKFLHSSLGPHEQVTNQSAGAGAVTGIAPPTVPVTSPLSEFGGSSIPFSTSVGSSVAVPGTQRLTMSSGMPSQITAVQLGVQGGFLTGNQSSVSHVPSGSAGMPAASAGVVGEGHLTAEDAAAMYAQMTVTGTGGASLPLDASGTAGLSMPSSGSALVDVDVVQGGEAEVGDAGVPDVEMTGASASAGGADAAEEAAVETVSQGDAVEVEITKATEAAAVGAAGECGDTEAETGQHTSMINVEHGTTGGEEGMETTGAEDGNGTAQQAVGGDGTVSDAGQELARREGDERGQQHDQAKGVEGSEIGAEEEVMKETEGGHEGARDDQDGVIEGADGEGESGEADASERVQVGRDSGGGTEAKEDDEGAQDRFQEDGGEDIMTAAAWQSLDSINP